MQCTVGLGLVSNTTGLSASKYLCARNNTAVERGAKVVLTSLCVRRPLTRRHQGADCGRHEV